MAKKASSPVFTAPPWKAIEAPSIYNENAWEIIDDMGVVLAQLAGPLAEEVAANARIMAAAPEGYQLVSCMRNACEEHLSELNSEMVTGRPGASDEELDDLQAQIDNWT